MPRGPAGHKRSRPLQGLLLPLLGLAVASAGPVLAQDADWSSHPVDSALEEMNLKTDAGHAPDFVEKTRPSTTQNYIPVGALHPTRDVKVKSAADLKAAIADLDTTRIRHDRISGRKPPAETAAPAKRPRQN